MLLPHEQDGWLAAHALTAAGTSYGEHSADKPQAALCPVQTGPHSEGTSPIPGCSQEMSALHNTLFLCPETLTGPHPIKN